jgi:hypothetical protein
MIPVPSGVRVWLGRNLGFPARLHARRNRLEEPGSYLPTGARRIVAGACIFLESTTSICDSMLAWILAVISPMTSMR